MPAVANIMQIPIDTQLALSTGFRAGTIAATNDIESTGNELELNFNPNRFWTFSGSVTESKAINTNISDAVQKWIDLRMPVWTTLVDPITDPTIGTGQSQGWVATAANPQHLWWIHNYGGSQTAAQNFATFVDAPYSVIKQQEGKSQPSVRKYNFKFNTSYQLAGLTDNKYHQEPEGGYLRPLGGQGRHRLLRPAVSARHDHQAGRRPSHLRRGPLVLRCHGCLQDEDVVQQGVCQPAAQCA